MKNRSYLIVPLLLLISWLPGKASGDLLSEEDVEKIIRVCSAGQSTSAISKMRETIHKIGDGTESKQDRQHKKVDEKTNVGAIFMDLMNNNEAKSELYSKYIECVEMYLEKSRQEKKEKVEINYYLPKNETISPGIPILIIDGKVALTLTLIKEGRRRKPLANIRVEVPKRKDYTRNLYNGQNLSFQYFDKTYKLYITNIKLNDNTADVTIQEM